LTPAGSHDVEDTKDQERLETGPQLAKAGPVHEDIFAVAFDEAPSLAQLPVPKIKQKKLYQIYSIIMCQVA